MTNAYSMGTAVSWASNPFFFQSISASPVHSERQIDKERDKYDKYSDNGMPASDQGRLPGVNSIPWSREHTLRSLQSQQTRSTKVISYV